jgi:MFS family permease
MSAGRSGLMLAPLTGGSVVGAFSSGQIMRATGNYKRQPLVGLSLATLALTLLAFMTADTSEVLIGACLALVGAGVGATFPVMLVAVQNATEPGAAPEHCPRAVLRRCKADLMRSRSSRPRFELRSCLRSRARSMSCLPPRRC